MTNVIAVAQREIVDRRRLIGASLTLGGLTLILPLLPMAGFQASYSQSRDILASFLGFVLLNAVAIGMGMNVIARDLAERRMSFYFARPLSGIEIWGGKMLGGLLLAVACAVAVIIPATLMGGGLFALQKINSQYFSTTSPSVAFASSLSLAIIALILTHPLSIALRSRSKWLVLDFVAWTVVGFSVFLILLKLGQRGAPLENAVMKAFGLIFIAVLLIGGALQVMVGRTDIVRGHKAMSITVWSIAAAFVFAVAAYVAWLESSTPRDLRFANAGSVSIGGEWVSVEGMRRFGSGYPLQYLVNASDGRFVESSAMSWSYAPLISDDSSHAVWFEKRAMLGSDPRFVAMWASLRGQPRAIETEIAFEAEPASAISADGIRLATLDEAGTLVVSDLAARRTLAAVRVPVSGETYRWRVRLGFVGSDVVRVYLPTAADSVAAEAGPLSIGEVDLATRTYRKTGEIARVGYFIVNRAMDRILAFDSGAKTVDLADGRTGASIAPISRTRGSGATFIPGRRVAMYENDNGVMTARIFDFDGRLVRSIPVRQGGAGSVGWSVAPGQLLVDTYARPDSFDMGHALDLVDIDRGTVRSLGTTWNRRPWSRSAEVPVAHPLFNTKDNRIVTLDPATGAWRDVLR